MKVIINTCYGGFQLSKAVYDEMGWEWDGYGFGPDEYRNNIGSRHAIRSDPKVVEVVERLGEAANPDSRGTQLKVVEIPDDVEFQIEDYDGIEWVAEKHRTWS